MIKTTLYDIPIDPFKSILDYIKVDPDAEKTFKNLRLVSWRVKLLFDISMSQIDVDFGRRLNRIRSEIFQKKQSAAKDRNLRPYAIVAWPCACAACILNPPLMLCQVLSMHVDFWSGSSLFEKCTKYLVEMNEKIMDITTLAFCGRRRSTESSRTALIQDKRDDDSIFP